MRGLVVVLDGFSYVFGNTFVWWSDDLKRMFALPNAHKGFLYVDVPPETPVVANAFFRLPMLTSVPTKTFIWEHFPNLKVKVINVPVRVPALWYGVQPPRGWTDFFPLPKEGFDAKLRELHRFVLENGDADILFVWYPIPDEAHHYFFGTIPDLPVLKVAIRYYGLAARFAVELISRFRPERWVILSDHGFSSDAFESPLPIKPHIRDALVISNFEPLPKKASEVPEFLFQLLTKRK